MKQKVLKLMCLLCVGMMSMSAWAVDAVYSLTPDSKSTGSSSATYITTLTAFTADGISWKMNQWNPSTLQIKTNQSSAESEFRFYNTSAFPGRIKQVVITFSSLSVSNASKLMFLGGSTEVTATTGGTAGTWDSSEKTLTWTPGGSENYTYFAFYQNGKAASGTNYLASSNAIVVTYELTGTETTTVIDASGITNTNVVTSTAAGTLSASVTYDNSGTPTAVPGAAVTWTSSNPLVATINSAGVVTLVAAGTTTITASYAGTTGYLKSSNTYKLNVTTDGYTHDIINQSLTDVTGSTYTFKENLTATSSAVYSVQCAGSNSSVQLRSDNSNSGIFSTTSGGYARIVKVTWNSNTSKGRTLNVYGKNTPYVKDGTSASILYDATTQGTLLGTIVCGTSTELTITGDYAYIALRSASGAMYLTDIDIAWEPVYNITVSTSGYATFYSSEHAYTMPAGLTGFVAINPSAGKITLKPAYSAGDVVPAGVALVLKGSADDYTLAWTTGGVAPTENLLKGTDTDAATTGGDKYYKLSYDSTGENLGFYWATADGAAFTNGAHKAYLALTDAQASSVKGFRLDFDEATGITELTESTEKTEGTEEIYNLNGQRLNGVQKGINIVGGKKVLVK